MWIWRSSAGSNLKELTCRRGDYLWQKVKILNIKSPGGMNIISNRCILPEGWTAETLMQPHDSIPYNPDIANVFYRAGYIETWGQGIQKICDECTALGADLPKYEIIGTGLRVYFPALKSALIDQPNTLNRHDVGKDVGL